MWNITSNNIQRAKDQLELRHTEMEARYAEEKKALDAEFAVIETLERAASEFMLRHSREDGVIAAEPIAQADPPGGDQEDSYGAMIEEASQPAAAIDMSSGGEIGSAVEGFVAQPVPPLEPLGSGEISGNLDILKPGSRWRLYRGNRATDPEGGGTGDASSTAG